VAKHPTAPEVRLEFAKRLRWWRTARGFVRARDFASVLGIKENRYTRYERAEVEPNLALIHKMCETLRVSPNDLLGSTESNSRNTVNSSKAMAIRTMARFPR
jgi:transcriptional regulator with XRE-family HTH domain